MIKFEPILIEEEPVGHSEQQISDVGDVPSVDNGSNTTGEESSINLWELVDVVGSPTLTGLIRALAVEECENISILDLSGAGFEFQVNKSCKSIISCTSSNKPQVTPLDECFGSETNQAQQARWALPPSPLSELYPFPVSRIVLRDNTCRKCPLLSTELRMSEPECREKFRILEKLASGEIQTLEDSMWDIAWTRWNLGQFQIAEYWWRQVIAAKRINPGYHRLETFHACLKIVNCLCRQGRYQGARKFHEQLHQNILNSFPSDHYLALIQIRHYIIYSERQGTAKLKRLYAGKNCKLA